MRNGRKRQRMAEDIRIGKSRRLLIGKIHGFKKAGAGGKRYR